MQLSDNEFIKQFENQTLDPTHFNHIGHLRLCWLYLQKYDFENAIEYTCLGIHAYAQSLGANDKFHRTITEFLVRYIHSKINLQPQYSFSKFLKTNKNLVNDAQSVLGQYYSTSLLTSENTRLNYIPPDLFALSN